MRPEAAAGHQIGSINGGQDSPPQLRDHVSVRGQDVSGEGGWTGAEVICHCLLVETSDSSVLIDTGMGVDDLRHPYRRLGVPFAAAFRPSGDTSEAAVERIRGLGFDPTDVRHIACTHLDLDHAGGLPDFPDATCWRASWTRSTSRSASASPGELPQATLTIVPGAGPCAAARGAGGGRGGDRRILASHARPAGSVLKWTRRLAGSDAEPHRRVGPVALRVRAVARRHPRRRVRDTTADVRQAVGQHMVFAYDGLTAAGRVAAADRAGRGRRRDPLRAQRPLGRAGACDDAQPAGDPPPRGAPCAADRDGRPGGRARAAHPGCADARRGRCRIGRAGAGRWRRGSAHPARSGREHGSRARRGRRPRGRRARRRAADLRPHGGYRRCAGKRVRGRAAGRRRAGDREALSRLRVGEGEHRQRAPADPDAPGHATSRGRGAIRAPRPGGRRRGDAVDGGLPGARRASSRVLRAVDRRRAAHAPALPRRHDHRRPRDPGGRVVRLARPARDARRPGGRRPAAVLRELQGRARRPPRDCSNPRPTGGSRRCGCARRPSASSRYAPASRTDSLSQPDCGGPVRRCLDRSGRGARRSSPPA